MNKIVKVLVIVCFTALLCFAGYRVYDKASTGAVERHDGVQIGKLYINAATGNKTEYSSTKTVPAAGSSASRDSKSVSAAKVKNTNEDIVSKNTVSENAVSRNTVSDNTVSKNSVSDNIVSGNAVSKNAVSENAVSGNTVSENTIKTDETEYVEPKAKSEEFFSRTRYLDGSFEICWKPVRGACGYKVYGVMVKSDGTIDRKILLDRVEDTRYIVNDIETSAVYHFGIKPVFDDDTVKSPIKLINLCKPAEISEGRTNRISDTKVNIKWTASSGANGYKISYRTANGYFKDLAEVDANTLNAEIKADKDYIFRIVPFYDNGFTRIRTEGSALIKYRNITGDVVSLDHQKYTSNECYEDMEILMMRYSDIMKTDVLGYSEDGRELVDIILGNEDAEAALLVVCEIHAREYITTAMMMRIVEYYLQNYYGTIDDTKVCDLLKETCIHFVVMANPDGLEISQNLTSRWKANANGINLNANFPYNHRSAGKRIEGTYTGDEAASEKESQAIVRITRDLSQKYSKFGVLSYHAMGQIVFGSYKEENEVLKERISEMYDIVVDSTEYKDAGSLDGGPAYGNYREYLIYVVEVPAITIEVGATACPCDVSDYMNAYTKNRFVPMRVAGAIAGWD